MSDMRRREFITLLGGAAAAAWPLTVRAQQGERMRRVGVLSNPGADDAEMQSRTAAFVRGLQELGWTVGRNLQIDYRWSNGNAERLRAHAVELMALQSGVSIMPLLEASRSVPVVFAQTIDPVGLGVVESLSRPGGNITGFTQFEYSIPAKWPGEAKWDSALSDQYGHLPLSRPPDFKRIPRRRETPANGAHHRHRRLLRARGDWPRDRTAEQYDELAPFDSTRTSPQRQNTSYRSLWWGGVGTGY